MKNVKISGGNTKVGRIPNISLPPGCGCPSDAPCRASCYAQKAWKQYPQTRSAWKRNWSLQRDDRDTYFDSVLNYLRAKRPKLFRWHVSGDIPDQNYLDQVIAVARLTPETRHLAFTKRHNLNFEKANKINNLSIVLSMWNNYGNTRKRMPRAWMLDPADPDPRIPRSAIRCPGSCETCFKCWILKDIKRDVVFLKH